VVADRTNPLPLYIQVRETIRREIETGVLPPGGHLMPEPELAQRHGVSRITVKHALRDLAAEGLLVRIKCKGTFVSLRPGANQPVQPVWGTRALALVVPNIEDLFLSEIYRGVAEATRQGGYEVLVLSSDRQVDIEAENLRKLGAMGEQGAAIFPNWGRANAE
jgi:DNA-binding transcriptional regulator YhcF (GntR family)